ncbi:MAG: hypothetical protein JSV56_12460 [Methanomassiliicoccales archaeon]|nr:MAG: hypothetical protein JSV56_12460 [Methanomassiliicoccales archaeon]
MKKDRDASKGSKKNRKSLKKRISEFRSTPEFKTRIRWILFVLAFLLLFLAFEVGDDWFVREFANYDWARQIGY